MDYDTQSAMDAETENPLRPAVYTEVPESLQNYWDALRKHSASVVAEQKALITEKLNISELKDPTKLIVDAVVAKDRKALIAYGEANHSGEGTLLPERNLVAELHDRFGVKAVFMEEDPQFNKDVEHFYQTGQISDRLIHYLTEEFTREDGPNSHKLELLKECKLRGVPVKFIDGIDPTGRKERDEVWSDEMITTLGDEIDGVYVLIAGQNHVMHTPLHLNDGSQRKTAGNFLSNKYKDKVISIKSMTIDNRFPPLPTTIFESIFVEDLKELGKAKTPSGIRLNASPYANTFDNPYNRVVIGEAFDIAIMNPGRQLSIETAIQEESKQK